MTLPLDILLAAWEVLKDSAIYMLFGILFAGLLKVFLPPGLVARQLGRGRFSSVLKAALFGIPIPLCSCGVLPAAASLKKQGANTGATTAFLISTPESGVDSIAVSYALLDPVLTVARPAAGFAAAAAAGLTENLLARPEESQVRPDLSCPVDGCCDGVDCPPEEHTHHHSFSQKAKAGLGYSFGELWADLAGWFMIGLLLAGAITVFLPQELISRHLGGGLGPMLLMLVVAVPMYVCATASTPIAAALILKGISPGTALVFLLAGPATNLASLTVLWKLLGRRATVVYLAAVAGVAVAAGLVLDLVYSLWGLSAQAMVGQASELIPSWAKLGGAFILLAISVKPVWRGLKARLSGESHDHDHGPKESPNQVPCQPGGT